MSQFLRPQYQNLKPYTPGEQINADYIKLNTNESPFPPSPRVGEVLRSGIEERLHLYSDPTLGELHRAVATKFGLTEDYVMAANGSDDVLAFAIMAYAGSGGALVCPDITYGFYPVYANLFGAKLVTILLRDDFSLNAEAYFNAPGTVVIANPNAPTGIALPLSEIERIIAANPENIVIIDEAYMPFHGESCIPLLAKYDNLLVTMTMSKSHSLAGLRVGFAIANPHIIADLNRIRYSFNPYNLNAISIKAAAAAIADDEYYDGCIAEINRTRAWVTDELVQLGFTCTPSVANFIFAAHPAIEGNELYRKLKERMILVRHLDSPRARGHVRISVGTTEQMTALINEIRSILEDKNA